MTVAFIKHVYTQAHCVLQMALLNACALLHYFQDRSHLYFTHFTLKTCSCAVEGGIFDSLLLLQLHVYKVSYMTTSPCWIQSVISSIYTIFCSLYLVIIIAAA